MEATLLPDGHWPDSVRHLPCISEHKNRSIRVWTIPGQDQRMLLKCLAPPFDKDAEEDVLFAREYLLLQRLRHPNLVRVRGYRTILDGTLVIAMDEAPGTSLGSIPTCPGWTPAKAAIARQILAGLDAVHRSGFVHADLQPDHVFIDDAESSPRVTLLDLGLATRQGEYVLRGTLDWMPPEIIDGAAPWTVQSDLYLFGLVLHQVAYGGPLFPIGDDPDLSLTRRRQGKVVSAHEHVDHRLEGILNRLVEVEPARRPSSARAVWEELREIRPTDAANMPDPALCSEFHAFHGREWETDEFAEWLTTLSRIQDPVTATCRVRGEPGIGKSALIDNLVARAETLKWNPRSLPTPPADSEEPIRAVLRDPRGVVLVEVRELSADAGTQNVWRPTDERSAIEYAGIPIRHEIALGPLSPRVAQRIVQDKLDGDALIKRVAVLSLGNPRLLIAICRSIDWLTEFAWREFPDAAEELPPERGAPPEECLSWLQAQGRALPPRVLESLSLAALVRWWSPLLIEEVIGRSWTTVVADLKPFYERELVVDDRGKPRLLCRSWEDAAILAATDAREIIRLLLDRTSHVRSAAKLTQLTDLAIMLELWTVVRQLFDKAVCALLDEGRHQEATVFLYRTYNALPDGMDVATPELWHRLSETWGYGDGASAFARPNRLIEQLPNSVPSDLRPIFRAWFLADARRKPEGRKALGRLEDLRDKVPPSVTWIATYLKCHVLSDLPASIYPELRARTLGWLTHPRFSSTADQFYLRFLYVMRFSDFLEPPEQLDIIESMKIEPGVLPWKDAIIHLWRAGAYFHLGRLEEAQSDAEIALTFLQSMVSNSLLRLAYQTSAAIAYELGDFKRTYPLSKRLARLCLLHERLADCAWQLRNLSLVDWGRGHIGMALADNRTAETLHFRAYLNPDDVRRAWLDLFLRWEAGDPTVIPEIASALTEYPGAIHNRRTLGLHELGTEHPESGRNRLRSAVDSFLAKGRNTEARDTLARWLEVEVDLGNRPEAEELFLELQRDQSGMTPKTRLYLRVIEAHMLVLGWLEPHGNLESILLRLILVIRDRGFGLQFWRTHWYLARFCHDQGRVAEATGHYTAARRFLQELIDTLENDEQREGFRTRPGPRRFLAEAGSREV